MTTEPNARDEAEVLRKLKAVMRGYVWGPNAQEFLARELADLVRSLDAPGHAKAVKDAEALAVALSESVRALEAIETHGTGMVSWPIHPGVRCFSYLGYKTLAKQQAWKARDALAAYRLATPTPTPVKAKEPTLGEDDIHDLVRTPRWWNHGVSSIALMEEAIERVGQQNVELRPDGTMWVYERVGPASPTSPKGPTRLWEVARDAFTKSGKLATKDGIPLAWKAAAQAVADAIAAAQPAKAKRTAGEAGTFSPYLTAEDRRLLDALKAWGNDDLGSQRSLSRTLLAALKSGGE